MQNLCTSKRFIGLDLAWSVARPSGVAVLDGAGNVLDVRADLVGDDAVVAWIHGWLAPQGAIGIDMPTVVVNDEGIRACERELAVDFRRYHAAPHPANRRRFPQGGRARHILDRLQAAGVREACDLDPAWDGVVGFEVYPHPAHVRLFELPRVFAYKKKQRPWPLVLSEWARYRAAMTTLEHADPPLHLPSDFPHEVGARGYKAWEDALDAISCAYIASYVYRFGTRGPQVRVYGTLDQGYIVVPARPALGFGGAGVES